MNFTLIRTLGSGGQGKAYLAEDESGNLVTLKTISVTAEKDYNYRLKKLTSEIQNLKLLANKHCDPLIICYKSISFNDITQEFYIVTDYIQGQNLELTFSSIQYFLDTSPDFFYDSFYSMLCMSISTLSYIHSFKVIHGDIKPQNIIIRTKLKLQSSDTQLINTHIYQPVFIDFGLSCYKPCDSTSGTLYYKSPEFIDSSIKTFASDVWSLAITYLDLIHPVWPNLKNPELKEYIRSKKYSLLVKTPHKHINYLLNHMLIQDPSTRLTATQLLNYIQKHSPNLNVSYQD